MRPVDSFQGFSPRLPHKFPHGPTMAEAAIVAVTLAGIVTGGFCFLLQLAGGAS